MSMKQLKSRFSKKAAQAAPEFTALVTGGSGFLGRHIVEHLLSDGRYTVRVFDIRAPAEPIDAVEYYTGDLRQIEDVKAACDGCDVIFHVATAAPTGANAYNKDLMRGVNVDGTANVIEACVQLGVPALVYTSSASVVFEGKNLLNVDETTPYAARPMDYYTQTKIDGEKLVLEANGKGGLATCALRPSGIFGEYDQLFISTTVNNARKGKLKYIIGDGKNMMDWTYAGNVADAHLLAADTLMNQGGAKSAAGGQAYFITNDDPRPFWGFMGDVCQGLGYPRPHIHLPFLLIYIIACILQYVIMPLLSPIKKIESDFVPSRIKIASVNRVFSCDKAKKDLGYRPAVGVDDAVAVTCQHFDHLKAASPSPSKP